MNTLVQQLHKQAMMVVGHTDGGYTEIKALDTEKFARLIIEECISVITNYEIPVGNSAAGEIACDMTYRALVDIRKQIRDKFGVQR